MRRSTRWMLLGSSAGVVTGLAAAYGVLVRPWHLGWGATLEERERPMPFDQLIAEPNYFSTRAIDIDASPDLVWPFLIDASLLPHGTVVRQLEEKKWLALAPPEVEAEATWVIVLDPVEGNRTRLVSRNRARFRRNAHSVARYLLVDPGQFLIERSWLLKVKERAERLRRTMQMSLSESVGEPIEPEVQAVR